MRLWRCKICNTAAIGITGAAHHLKKFHNIDVMETKNKKRKKGETAHHCFYQPEIVVRLPNKATHLAITAFQSMKDKEKKRKYLIETIFALISELWKEENNYQDKRPAK